MYFVRKELVSTLQSRTVSGGAGTVARERCGFRFSRYSAVWCFFLLAAVATIVFDFFDRYGTFLFLSIIRVPWTVDRDLAFKRPFLSF